MSIDGLLYWVFLIAGLSLGLFGMYYRVSKLLPESVFATIRGQLRRQIAQQLGVMLFLATIAIGSNIVIPYLFNRAG